LLDYFIKQFMPFHSLALFFLLLLSFFPLQAQDNAKQNAGLNPEKAISQYRIDIWQREQGLPQNSVLSVKQIKEGFLWFTTFDGVARFDGLVFESMFKEGNYASHNYASQMQGAWDVLEDSQQRLWVATQGAGLIRYQNGRATIFTTNSGLPNNDIFTLAEDKEGRIWYATRKGVGYFKDNKFKNFTKKDGLVSNYITQVFVDNKGRVWIGTDRGIHLFKKGRIINYTRKILFFNKSITAITQDKKGYIWIGTPTGLIRWNPEKNTQVRYDVESGLSNDYITALFVDSENVLWIGTQSGGLNRFYKGKFTALTVKEGLSSNSINAITQDREGSLWLGLNRGGLVRISDGKFIIYNVEEGLTDRVTNCILEDKKGGFWIGTTNGGVSYFYKGVFKNITTEEGLSGNYVRTIAETKDGEIWVGTYGEGIDILDEEGNVIKKYTEEDGLASNIIRGIIQASNGDIWIATREGLSLFSEEKFKNYGTTQGLSDNSIITLLEDKRQRIWIGTESGGVNVLYPSGKIEKYRQQEEGLADNLVFCFFEDGDYMWVGTKGGLSRVYHGKVISLSVQEGLANPSVQSLSEDNEHRLWMSCNSGVFWVEKQELYQFCDGDRKSISSTLYDESDGLKSSDCASASLPAVCRDKNGNLWYPTTEGVAMIDPSNIRMNTKSPLVTVKKILAGDIAYNTYDEIHFPAGTNKLEFEYAGLSFIAPEQVTFKYRLKGFDEMWVMAGKRRTAYYTNLNPGEYTFEVMAMNHDGVWSRLPAKITFYIEPYFYQTTFFAIFIFLLIASTGFGVYYWRIKNLELSRKKLQRGIEEQTKQIKLQYNEIRTQAKELEALDNIVQTINQEVTLDNVLDALLIQGLKLFDKAEKAIFLIYNTKKEKYVLVSYKGYPEDFYIEPIKKEKCLKYCEQGRQHSEGFYLISPKKSKNKISETYQPLSSLAMLIEYHGSVAGIVFFDQEEEDINIQPTDMNKLKRFRDHALSAFQRAQNLQQIENKNLEIERSLKKMADSIRYAKRIQNAIFVDTKDIENAFDEAFVFYKPKDIVSGDFYWFTETMPEPVYDVEITEEGSQSVFKGFSETFKILAAVDCTGHGVPGALMTVVGNDLLDSIVKQKQAIKPSQILRQLDLGVKTYLKQEEGTQSNDGMDMSIITIDEAKNRLTFAGAKNPLIHIRKGELTVHKGAKFPIGGIQIKRKVFKTTTIPYEKGDVFYLFSDGFQDQFGGDKERKYGPKRFRNLLLEINEKSMKEQKEILSEGFKNWKRDFKQTDDVLVIGIRL